MLRRNVLIFHTGALGDLVLSWPLALAAGRLFPQSRIIYVTHGEKGALSERVLRVEWADIESGWHRLFAEGDLPVPAWKTLASAHTIFSFLGDENDAWMQNVRSINPSARLVQLRTRPPAAYSSHASSWLVEQLAGEAATKNAVDQMLRSIASRGIGLRGPRRDGPIVIHPGSGSRDKCWPVENYLKLIETLRAEGLEIRVIVGPVERERWSEGQIAALSRAAPLRQPANFIELLEALNGASFYIGNDSGPTHLAGIIGLPGVAIFTASDLVQWRPLGPQVRVLSNPSVAQVLEAASAELIAHAGPI